jgi:phosphoribosylformylglycinamidine (FGAM) synthase PurS component
VICAYQNETRKKILEDILHSVGGEASHGMCPKAFELEMRAIDDEEAMEAIDDRCQKWRLDDFKTA